MLIRRSGTQVIGERQAVSLPGEVDLATASDFDLGSLEVQPSTLQVRFGGASRTIEPRVMQVLVLLANERGSVVSRDRLIDCCWGGRIVGEDAINRCIAKVRRLGAESGAFEVETIPRVGYRLAAADAESSTAVTTRLFPARILLIAIAAVLVTALVAGGLWYWGTAEPQQPKVAVLSFTPLNADADTGNIGKSIAATVGNALVQTGALLPEGNIRTLDNARKWGAAIIVGGTVRRDGPTVVVTARVDSAGDGSTILTNEFPGDAGDSPALAGRVAAWLVPPVRMWSSFLPVESDAATNNEILRIFLTRNAGDLLRAWKLSRTLAAAKPNSGAAQLVVALLTSDVLAMIEPEQRQAAVESARQAAIRATRLLPDPARPRAVLECHFKPPGWLVLTPGCDRSTRAAIAADPDVPLLPFLFGWQLAQSGRFVEAVKFADMDLAQSPLGPGQLGLRIFVTRMSPYGAADEVLPQLEERMRRYMGPGALANFQFRAAIAQGDMVTADALLNDPKTASNSRGHSWDAMTPIAVGGARETIELVLRAVRTKSPADVTAMEKSCIPPPRDWTPPDPAFGTCLVGLTLVGNLDGVFALADRGYRDVECCSPADQERQWLVTGGDYYPREALFGKALAPVRADPRFVQLARRTGLLAYWKSGHPPDFCSFERVPVCQLLRAN